jgi:hypothetical protein
MNQNSNLNRPSVSEDGKKTVVDDAKQIASHATERVQEQASQKLDSQKRRAVDTIGDVAAAVRTAGEGLDDGPLPDLAERAADSIENVASYIQSRTVGDILGEVERFARREPAIFLGASFAVGLLGGRFLKSSARNGRDRRQERRGPSDDRHDAVVARPTIDVGGGGSSTMRSPATTPTPMTRPLPSAGTAVPAHGGKVPNTGSRGGA